MTDQFWDVAWRIGVPFVMVVVALLASMKGIWVWGWQVDHERKQWEANAQRDRQRLERELLARDQQLAAKDDELKVYRDIALEALTKGEAAASKAEQAVGLVNRNSPRRRP